jgi:DNA-binding FadR family transcriptional regulator
MLNVMSRRPSTERLYHRIKEWVLTLPVGQRLGSELELLQQFDASRPTFRQAISILECELFVEIRRGNRGGYFSNRPTETTVTCVASDYCRSLGLPREEVIAAWMPIRVETVRLAARDQGLKGRDELEMFIAELKRGQNRHFAHTVRRFNALLALLAGNRLLSLFFEILHESGNLIDLQDFYRRKPERIFAYREQMLALLHAIAQGDEARAERASRACIDYNLQWAAEDRGASSDFPEIKRRHSQSRCP